MNFEEFTYKTGQRLCLGLPTKVLSDDFVEAVKRHKIGNAILFSRNLHDEEQILELTNGISKLIVSETGKKPFIMVDEEGGIMSRFPERLRCSPTAMALGLLDNEELSYKSGLCNGKMLSSLGINYNLAPSVDVNTCPDNPVIGVRSLSSDSKVVARNAIAIIRGQRDGAVYSAIKHFPGHGDTSSDTHLALPMVSSSEKELEKHIFPFKEAIKYGVDSIMTSHILFPALEKKKLPATMSKAIIKDYLRGCLGYDGVVLSDCMEMDAIRRYYGSEEGAFMAMKASVDIVLVSHHADVAVSICKALEEKYKNGEFSDDEIDASFNRICTLKNKKLECICNEDDFQKYKTELKETFKTTIGSISGQLPTYDKDSIFIGIADFGNSNIGSFEDEHPKFGSYLANALGAIAVDAHAEPSDEEINSIVNRARNCKNIYFGSYNSHRFPKQRKLIEKLLALKKNFVIVALCNPYDLDKEIRAKSCCSIVAWDYSLLVLDYLAKAIKEGYIKKIDFELGI